MKRLLTLFALLVGLTTQAQIPSYVPTEGLVGYWGFNGNANDESGNGNDGTVNGATLTEDRFGNNNSAYSFDGVNDYIVSPGGTNYINDSITISFWNYNTTNFFSNHEIICIGSPTSTYYGVVCTNLGTRLNYGRGCGETAQTNANTPFSLNTWNHILIRSFAASNQTEVYLNGTFQGYATNSNPSGCSNSNLYFGVDIFSAPEYYLGLLDDIGIWNRALTEEEVLALYNGCSVSIETIAGDLTPFTLEENTYNCTNTPNSTYEWAVEGGVITSGQGTSTVTVLWAEEGIGTLTVTETTEEGCEGSVSIEVEIVCATTATTIEGPLGPGELLEVTYTCDGDASSTYNWSISNGVITSGQGTNSVTVIWASTGLGSITVQETTSANCDGEEITLDVVVVVATGIYETLKESINIFPNPASTSVTISINESLINASYHLFDARGKLVSEGALTRTKTILNTTAFASGNYVIFIGHDQGMARQQILIEK